MPERFSREVGDLTGDLAADERWIQKARVIGGDEESAGQRQVIGADHIAAEKHAVERREEIMAHAVDRLHLDLWKRAAHSEQTNRGATANTGWIAESLRSSQGQKEAAGFMGWAKGRTAGQRWRP